MTDTPQDLAPDVPDGWDAIPQRIGRCNCDWLEAENRRLWERAVQADYATTRADLRAARLHLVLGSILRTFAKQRHARSDAWRTSQVETATLHRWRQVFETNRPGARRETPEAADRRRTLREQLVDVGTEAADQWLASRANRRMSEVNRRRLAGHVVGTLWEQIERATVQIAESIAEDDRAQSALLREQLGQAGIEWSVRYSDGTRSDAVILSIDDAHQQAVRNAHRGAHIEGRLVGQWRPTGTSASAEADFHRTMQRLRKTDPAGAALVEQMVTMGAKRTDDAGDGDEDR